MPERLTGKFLISAKHLNDPSFFRSVILIVQHDENGAMGLIINKPQEGTLQTLISGIPSTDPINMALFCGGPVDHEVVCVLHQMDEDSEEGLQILPNLRLGASEALLEQLMSPDSKTQSQFRIFCGYSGWSAGQLEAEIKRGDWYTTAADAETVFHEQPLELWEQLVASYEQEHRFLPIDPNVAQWN